MSLERQLHALQLKQRSLLQQNLNLEGIVELNTQNNRRRLGRVLAMANHWLWKRHSYHVNRFEDLQKSFKRTEQGMVAQAFLKHNEIEFLESSWYLLSCLSMTIFQVTFYILWFYRHVSCELALISERLEHEGLDQKYPARCL